MTVPVVWLSFCDENPARHRWDQNFIEWLLFDGWRPPGGATFEDRDPVGSEGRAIVFPGSHYVEHGDDIDVVNDLLSGYLRACDWSILFATSDECSQFVWAEVALPETCQLWVQYPRTHIAYPPTTRFLPLGPQSPPRRDDRLIPGYRPIDVYFSGQVFNERRLDLWENLEPLRKRADLNVVAEATGGFAQGIERSEYLQLLRDSWIAPAPSGPCSQDSFRLYEALDAGCIPVIEANRPRSIDSGFWAKVWPIPGLPAALGSDWSLLAPLVDVLLERRHFYAAERSAGWQQAKRALASDIRFGMSWQCSNPDDEITVIVMTSPIPSNPDLDMIQTVIASIRERLPAAEILIGCDGVRVEQEDRRANYEIFLHELVMWTNTQHNICPFVFRDHHHESGMMKALLPEVHTRYMLFVEGDCTLEGDLDFAAVLNEMDVCELNHVRFMHETHVLPEHEYLFLETVPEEGLRHLRTIQFSTRPSLMRTGWITSRMDTYFGDGARTMIEDVLYGPFQHGAEHVRLTDGTYARGTRAEEAWELNRGAVWAPGPNLRYSGHLDGRGADPKFPMRFEYPTDEAPPGAPQPGTR